MSERTADVYIERPAIGMADGAGLTLRITAAGFASYCAAPWFNVLAARASGAEASGVKPVMLSPEVARYSHEHVGNEFIGWLHFQPIYEHLAETQPDMFD